MAGKSAQGVGWRTCASANSPGREVTATERAYGQRRGADELPPRQRAGRHSAGLPHRNSEPAGPVAEIGLDAATGESRKADRQDLQQGIVAAEGRGLAVASPVRLEDELGNVAIVGPAGGDALGAFRGAAMQENHVGMSTAYPVEAFPDQVMVVVIGS